VFLVSLPVGVAALIVGLATLKIPPHPEAGRDVDYAGAGLLVTGVSAVLIATVWGGAEYPWGSGQILGLYAGGALLVGLFIARGLRIPHPLVPLRLFGDRAILSACLAGFSVGVAMFGAIMFVPLFVQGAIGASATSSGAVLTPLMLAMMLRTWGGRPRQARPRHPSRVRHRHPADGRHAGARGHGPRAPAPQDGARRRRRAGGRARLSRH